MAALVDGYLRVSNTRARLYAHVMCSWLSPPSPSSAAAALSASPPAPPGTQTQHTSPVVLYELVS